MLSLDVLHWITSTCSLRCVSKEVHKVSVYSIVHYVLVLLAKLLIYQLCQSLVKPLHILKHGKSVRYHTFTLMFPQREQHLEVVFLLSLADKNLVPGKPAHLCMFHCIREYKESIANMTDCNFVMEPLYWAETHWILPDTFIKTGIDLM